MLDRARPGHLSDLLGTINSEEACDVHTSSYWDSQKTIDTIRVSLFGLFNAENIEPAILIAEDEASLRWFLLKSSTKH